LVNSRLNFQEPVDEMVYITCWHYFILVFFYVYRVESVQLKIEDPEKITGSIISAGQGGFVKYWDTKQ